MCVCIYIYIYIYIYIDYSKHNNDTSPKNQKYTIRIKREKIIILHDAVSDVDKAAAGPVGQGPNRVQNTKIHREFFFGLDALLVTEGGITKDGEITTN